MTDRHENITPKYFSLNDYNIIKRRLENLKMEISDLGREQGEVSRQSGENMGHDDFGQEDVHRRRLIVVEQIKTLQAHLQGAHIINTESLPRDKVRIGSRVTLGARSQTEVEYIIGSYFLLEDEKNKISYSSRIGRSLLGKEVGDEVLINGQKYSIIRLS